MNEIFKPIIEALVPILCLAITAGGAYLIALLRKKTAILEKDLDNATAAKYIDMAVDAVDQAVTYVAQTFVDGLKSENAFTKDRQLEAFYMARDKVLEILSNTAVRALDEIYGDFDAWMDTRIEQVCRDLKTVPTNTAEVVYFLPTGDAAEQVDKSSPENETPERAVSEPLEACEPCEDILRAQEAPVDCSNEAEWPVPLPEEPEEPESEVE